MIRNAEALEILEKVDTLVVDKTGTLTEGRPRLRAVIPVADVSEGEVLRLAASVEVGSEHPLAAAIVEGAEARGIKPVAADGFRSVTSKGVVARVDGRVVSLGNVALMRELGVEAGAVLARADELRSEGQTVMFVARDGRLIGLVGVADPIKGSAPEALEQLRHVGLTIVMLAGDSRRTAEAVAAKLGITHVEAEVLPERKIEVVRDLRVKGGKVDVQFGIGHRQRASAAAGPALNRGREKGRKCTGLHSSAVSNSSYLRPHWHSGRSGPRMAVGHAPDGVHVGRRRPRDDAHDAPCSGGS